MVHWILSYRKENFHSFAFDKNENNILHIRIGTQNIAVFQHCISSHQPETTIIPQCTIIYICMYHIKATK